MAHVLIKGVKDVELIVWEVGLQYKGCITSSKLILHLS